jgi:glutathione S-transferase
MTTHWMLLELEAEHEQVVVDVQAGETRTADYLAMNLMGKVPMLVDDGVVVTLVAELLEVSICLATHGQICRAPAQVRWVM